MSWYSQYVDQLRKKGGYCYQKLPGGDHSALGSSPPTVAHWQNL